MELPSDSNFAIAMKTQQQAEREEQQRIKNLVLNYELNDAEEQEAMDRPTTFARSDKSGHKGSFQRARKLQLSDVDWYDEDPLCQPLNEKGLVLKGRSHRPSRFRPPSQRPSGRENRQL